MQLTFLGTSCMVPTKDRNHVATLLEYGPEGILFDCGEGTQRQMKITGIKPTKVTKILISHWHGDHVLGIPGLLQTLGASDYTGALEIYGPPRTKNHIDKMFEAFVFDNRVNMKIIEISKSGSTFFENDKFTLSAYALDHKIPCLGYVFQEKDRLRIKVPFIKKKGIPEGPLLGKLQNGQDVEFKGEKILASDATYSVKGKKIAIIADTVPTNTCYEMAQDADYLICESAYTSKLQNKAEEYKHMTARGAGLIASRADVKKLILFHYSQRYKNTQEIEEDARNVFDNIICAQDFMKIRI
ncbi:ribonuclease Z [Candidatus Woesearchaeota archaeon]|nr:ribonuclease Z [Candidatus Woesearchaeota archaeon]